MLWARDNTTHQHRWLEAAGCDSRPCSGRRRTGNNGTTYAISVRKRFPHPDRFAPRTGDSSGFRPSGAPRPSPLPLARSRSRSLCVTRNPPRPQQKPSQAQEGHPRPRRWRLRFAALGCAALGSNEFAEADPRQRASTRGQQDALSTHPRWSSAHDVALTVPARQGTGALHCPGGDLRRARLCARRRDPAWLAFFLVAYNQYCR